MTTKAQSNHEEAQALPELDRLIHEPARLTIVAHLFVISEADFIYLEQKTQLTRGNLSSHLRKLEDAGYTLVEKKFVERIPRTVVQLTETGRMAFVNYRKAMLGFLGR